MLYAIQNYLPEALKCMIITVVAEVFISFLLKIRNYKLIIIVNISTQLFLHIILFTTFYTSIYKHMDFILKCTEVAILFIEFILYSIFIKDKKKILLFIYALVANLTTFLLGSII